MQCARCGQDNLPEAKFCAKCGAPMAAPAAPPPPSPGPNPPPGSGPQPSVPQGKLVYPKSPPLSPHLAWLNLLIPGLSHFLFGQTMKGVVWLVGCLVLWGVGMGWAVAIASAVDGYMVGNVLASGRPVGEWQFFPS